MQDRLDALTIFVAVAEQQSFAEAARQLGRSPASVTRGVAVLEERLQTRLFNRTTRSVALTDAGGRYLENCRRLLAVHDELEAVKLSERTQPRGWINVTAPVMFGRLHVLPLVQEFLGEYPQVDIRLLLLDRVVSLVDEGLDLGVRIGQLPDSSLRQFLSGRSGASFAQLRNTSPATACRRRRAISATIVWWRAQPSHPFPTAGRFTVRAASLP
jgi:DNA-binding transcriptional LysR family regulator